ncbi:MAG: MerR family transcriptional regulator [Acidobacteria bacterium]|nr:MerR family transcriptional regulator [Acidobacteriota bacterium]
MERLTVGQLAKLARVNLETVRYYERCGLLPQPPRLSSGYRAFPVVSVERIRFIKQAQELGFSLKEIKELLALQIDPNSTGADVKKSAEAKINDMPLLLTANADCCAGRGVDEATLKANGVGVPLS